MTMDAAREPARVHPETREEWRAWLLDNHASASSVWLVSWKKAAGRPMLAYDDAVAEALAFGWIDSKGARLDDQRTMLYFSRRKRGSAWSGPNKVRVERMRREDRMHPAGEAVVAAAQQDGSWSRLDAVERLIVPPDLDAAFAEHPGSRTQWDAFPPSTRRGILAWIVQARTAPTRLKRVRDTAEHAARGERAHQ